ncbi:MULTISPECIES: two-component system sensor histidine kinase NtrB [unclassified Brevundimonas]|uniref:two-component system sensor histidine kinase NtrB n=1 Tax=unclassified Brevundimonas TaxID=2622653 RepID=UPI0025B94D23|nr:MULTISPECIES: ATP-binding protein [unclassified Brevundimonas]
MQHCSSHSLSKATAIIAPIADSVAEPVAPPIRSRPEPIGVAVRTVASLGLAAGSLSPGLMDNSYGLELLAPVTAMAATAALTGWRTTLAAQLLVWGGLAALSHAGTVDAGPALATGAASAIVAAITLVAYRPRRGIYGLNQTTESAVLRSVLEAVPVVLLNGEGQVKRASKACACIFGLPSTQIVGQPFSELVQGFCFEEHAHQGLGSRLIEPDRTNWLANRPDQSPVPVELWLDHTPDGPLIRLVDLTPRHAADAQARELHSQLNKVWRLNSLGEMAATLAHELNQPLGAAAAYLHAAQEDMKAAGPLGESALRTTDLAKAQMLRGGQIIRRMRELLTMEMRALEKERVSRVVDDVLPILTLTGQDRNIRITTDIALPDTVRMDRIQVQQALVNLVRNAVEASPNSSNVLITGQKISDRAYEIAVEDSGPGIAPDQVDSVFQPMTSTKSGGMGLGLSVTRTIVESHGGHLRVGVSRWGGARFSFNLTTANQDAEE